MSIRLLKVHFEAFRNDGVQPRERGFEQRKADFQRTEDAAVRERAVLHQE